MKTEEELIWESYNNKQIINNPNFKKWFGDSKVVDKSGVPLIVYHAGSFDGEDGTPMQNMHFGTEDAALARLKSREADDFYDSVYVIKTEDGYVWKTYYQTSKTFPSKELAEKAIEDEMDRIFEYYEPVEGSYEMTQAYLCIEEPKRVKDNDNNWSEEIRQARDEGYDGIVYENEFEDVGSDSYIVFEPTQIKSATANNGSFNSSDPNITR
jgi:hypothetical protein